MQATPSQIRSPVLKPIMTSSRSELAVDTLTSWQVGCALKVTLDKGSLEKLFIGYKSKGIKIPWL